MNQLQFEQISAAGVRATRGAVRDAITLFDENAALLQCPDPLWQSLQAKDWQNLFVGQRALWQQAKLVLFGHALLEKLAVPRAGITAHVFRVPMALQGAAQVDAWLATALTAAALASKPFAPLPVLGVPGWWPPNESPAFYGDTKVFRPSYNPVAALGGASLADSPMPNRALP